jgi:CBS domain containing-hemolysin-like protein
MQTVFNKRLINKYMKKNINNKIIITALSLFFLFFSFTSINAQSQLIDTTSTTTDSQGNLVKKYKGGDYTLNDVLTVGVRAVDIILGLVGSLALLFFVYGGVMFLISAGSSDKIKQAKTIIINAVVGLAIVFLSYLIVKFVLSAIGRTGPSGLG